MSSTKKSKRVIAKEWKQQRKKQRLLGRLVIVAICLMVALGAGYIGWDMWSRTYVMTFEGERISRDYMRYFSAFTDGWSDPREQSMEFLTQFLLVEQFARLNNIVLTTEELADVEENAEMIREHFETFGINFRNISDERMFELASINVLTDRLAEIYTVDFVVDEDEFESSFESHLNFNRAEFIEMELRYHQAPTMYDANVVHDQLTEHDAEDFETVVLREMQQTTGLSANELEIPTTTLEGLQDMGIDFWSINQVASLDEGEFSDPIQVGEDSFFIFMVDSISMPPEAELRETFRERHIEQMRQIEFFDTVIPEWREEADMQINERGVNAAL